MKTYTYYIREHIISANFEVQAKTEAEARAIAEQMFMDGEIETEFADGFDAVLTDTRRGS